MSEAEATAELAALRARVDELARQRAELVRELERSREEVAGLDAEVDALQRRHDALHLGSAPRIVAYVLLLAIVPGVLYFLYHTRVVLRVGAPVPRGELRRAMELADLPRRFDVGPREGERVTIRFSATLSQEEKWRLRDLLERLVELKPPAGRPSFTLETIRKGRDAPIRSRLRLALDTGDCRLVSHRSMLGARGEKSCVYGVPLAAKLPRAQHLGQLAEHGSWHNRLELPGTGELLLERKIRVQPAAYRALGEALELQLIADNTPLTEVSSSLYLVSELWREKSLGASGFFSREDMVRCSAALVHEGSALLMGGLVFPVLSRELRGFEIEGALF